jgi:multidrug transporter EmrE-like cation transporter
MKITQIDFVYVSFLILLIVFAEGCAQYCLKKYSNNKEVLWFLMGAFIYGIIAYFLVLSFGFEKLAIVNIMWGAFSAVILTFMAYYFYDETLTWTQIAGIVVIFIGTVLLHL